AVPDVSPDRFTMTRRVAFGAISCAALAVAALVACGVSERSYPAQNVPAKWRDVRMAIGHRVHLSKVACADCHGESFDAPAAELCTNCHATTSSLHHDDPTTLATAPACIECHGYGSNPEVTPWNCMRCH